MTEIFQLIEVPNELKFTKKSVFVTIVWSRYIITHIYCGAAEGASSSLLKFKLSSGATFRAFLFLFIEN